MEEKAMPEKKVIKGKVVHKEGKYFLDVAGKLEELPVGLPAGEKLLKEQVGQEVEVLYSIPKPAVVALKPLNLRKFIYCNIPVGGWAGGKLTGEMTRAVADKLLKDGAVTQEVHVQLLKGMG
jgi:hypothetical protein